MTPLQAPRVGLYLALALSLLAAMASAQTTPAKPAAKPAPSAVATKPAAKPVAKAAAKPTTESTAKTSSLSGKDDGGKVLNMEELRACLKQRDELTARVTKMEADRAEMEKERTGIQEDQGKLRADNENAGGLRPQADALAAKVKEFQAENNALAKRVAEFNENKTMTQREAERQRNEINATVEGLRSREKTLGVEREALIAKSDELSKEHTARKEKLDVRVAAWNERNRKLNADSEVLADERKLWTTDCGNRRYREEDEKAIQAGK